MIIDGREIAKKVQEQTKSRVRVLNEKGLVPTLAVVLVGENPASVYYVNSKAIALRNCGMQDRTFTFPEEVTQQTLEKLIKTLNKDANINGILVQLPLPEHLDAKSILNKIAPEKDVDGFTDKSAGAVFNEKESFLPCTPKGVLHLLKAAQVPLDGADVVIVGRSAIVGKALALKMMDSEINATVTVCHSHTKELKAKTKKADVLIVAVGKPEFITSEYISHGTAIIDVGINRVEDPTTKKGYRLVGDVLFEDVEKYAYLITPVPGGVGPMTIAMLLENTVQACINQHKEYIDD